jgi:hypothetical protein
MPTNAIFVPSGDHHIPPWVPQAFMYGVWEVRLKPDATFDADATVDAVDPDAPCAVVCSAVVTAGFSRTS